MQLGYIVLYPTVILESKKRPSVIVNFNPMSHFQTTMRNSGDGWKDKEQNHSTMNVFLF